MEFLNIVQVRLIYISASPAAAGVLEPAPTLLTMAFTTVPLTALAKKNFKLIIRYLKVVLKFYKIIS